MSERLCRTLQARKKTLCYQLALLQPRRIVFLTSRLQTAIGKQAQGASWVDKCLADLAKAAGTPLPMPLRSFGRWILEFPTHYNDLHVDPRLRLGRPRVVVPVDKGIGSVVFLAKNLWVESLRSGPRFDALLNRVGHPPMRSSEATQLD
jgi:hypothetical protein